MSVAIRSPVIQRQIEKKKTQTAQSNLFQGKIKQLELLLAPLAEQRRIVSKIESLQERSSRARRALSEVGPLLEQFRQSVLRDAFSGKLTADWRAQRNASSAATATPTAPQPTKNPAVLALATVYTNPPADPPTSTASDQTTQPGLAPKRLGNADETAHELLERIRTERRERWEAEQLAKYEAKGKKPPKNWQDKYKEPEPVDESELPELPEGWCWVRGEQLFEWASGKNLPKKKMRDGDVPVFGGNGCSGHHDEANVFEQTICIGRVGAHCGNVHLTPGDAWITDNAIYATSSTPSINLEFATYAFRSLKLNEHSRGGGQPYVNQDVLNDAVFPLPSIKEQEAIVELLDATREFGESQLAGLASMESSLTQLDQSILSKAFRGGLVPQDPRDEPASELLARIRKLREV